jgi:hypothetical protein
LRAARCGPRNSGIGTHSGTTIPDLLAGITLRNKITTNPGPPILRNANVTNFPPQNDVYSLVEPMELEDVNNPGPVLATIRSFPLTVTHSTP